MKAYLEAIGLQAPGLVGWQASQAQLLAYPNYELTKLPKAELGFLPANERRRTTKTIQLALRTAQDTLQNAAPDFAEQTMPTLFACVDGDIDISSQMTSDILADDPMISPIHFHNSVHNAPAGYWMIGHQNTAGSSSISAGEFQVANSWLEAVCQLQDEVQLLLVMYDLPLHPVIETYQPTMLEFGVGFLLTAEPTENSIAELNLQLIDATTSPAPDPNYGVNLAAQNLAILRALAAQKNANCEFALSKTQSLQLAWQVLNG